MDRVVAIVGDSAVLQTQLDEEIQRMELGGLPVPAGLTQDSKNSTRVC